MLMLLLDRHPTAHICVCGAAHDLALLVCVNPACSAFRVDGSVTRAAISMTRTVERSSSRCPPTGPCHLREMAAVIGCMASEIDSAAQHYQRDVMMIWSGPGTAVNAMATTLAGRTIHGVVVFTGPCRAVDLDLTSLSPHCMLAINGEARRTAGTS